MFIEERIKMIFSKNPKLNLEKTLVLLAIAAYVAKHIKLKKEGVLGDEPNLLVKIDKDRVLSTLEKTLKMNPAQKTLLSGLYDHVIDYTKKDDEV